MKNLMLRVAKILYDFVSVTMEQGLHSHTRLTSSTMLGSTDQYTCILLPAFILMTSQCTLESGVTQVSGSIQSKHSHIAAALQIYVQGILGSNLG
jgi:hypothetical protein